MTCFWSTSSYPGIDRTGLTPSNSAFNAMLAQAAANVANGTPTTIVIDCQVNFSTSNNAANTIFWPSGVNLQGTPDGMIINDQLAAPFAFFCNVSNITFQDVHIHYVQPLNGSYMSNPNVPNSYVSVAGLFQNSYLGGSAGYLSTVDNVQYALGGSPIWAGPSALTALFNMRGNCKNITFDNCTFDVPQGASPASFIYAFMQYAQEWAPNNVIIGERSFASAAWSAGTVTVQAGSGVLAAPFVLGSQYWFYVSSSANPGYANSNILVTIASTSTFTYPLATNPGAFSGTGYFGSQTISGVTANCPSNITWRNCTFDGVIMGHVGTAQVNFFDCTWNRYSDLQDGTNGLVTFSGTGPTAGATIATLAAAWSYPSAQYWVTLGNTQMLGMNFYQGRTNVDTFVDPISGMASSVVGTMVGTVAPGNGATSMTLTNWTLGVVAAFNGMQVQFTNPTNDVRTVTVTTVSPYTTFTASFSALSSACTSATQTLTVGATAISGNVGGVPSPGSHGYILSASPYSPPPHAMYMGSSTGSYPAWVVAKNCLDLGVRVYNTPTSRSLENSGNALSLKVELGRGTIIDGWTSYRPDGGSDLQSMGGTQGSSVSNCSFYFNSDTPLTDWQNNVASTRPGSITSGGGAAAGIPVFGVRMPGPNSYENINLSNISVFDSNPSPLQMAFLGTTFAPNQNISMTDIKVYLNDWGPPGAGNSNEPTIVMAGTNITLDASIYYNSMSTTTTYIGYVASAPLQNSNIWIKHYGFRTPAITLASTMSNATSVQISTANTTPPTPGCYPNGWPFNSGAVYKVIFADNSVRYCTITNSAFPTPGTITMTWSGAGVTANSSQLTGITAQGLYYQNFAGYKPRLVLPTTAGQTATRFRIDDYSNQYFQDALDNAITEIFSDSQNCTPPNGATSFTTSMTIPASYSLIALGIGTSTAFTGGMTGYTVGYAGSLAAFATVTSPGRYAQPTTFNPQTLNTIAQNATGTARTIVITPTGGNFDGVGTIQIAFRAQGSSMGS